MDTSAPVVNPLWNCNRKEPVQDLAEKVCCSGAPPALSREMLKAWPFGETTRARPRTGDLGQDASLWEPWFPLLWWGGNAAVLISKAVPRIKEEIALPNVSDKSEMALYYYFYYQLNWEFFKLFPTAQHIFTEGSDNSQDWFASKAQLWVFCEMANFLCMLHLCECISF